MTKFEPKRFVKISAHMGIQELDDALRHNDALEAIKDGCSREDYVAMHKVSAQEAAAQAWDSAKGA